MQKRKIWLMSVFLQILVDRHADESQMHRFSNDVHLDNSGDRWQLLLGGCTRVRLVSLHRLSAKPSSLIHSRQERIQTRRSANLLFHQLARSNDQCRQLQRCYVYLRLYHSARHSALLQC